MDPAALRRAAGSPLRAEAEEEQTEGERVQEGGEGGRAAGHAAEDKIQQPDHAEPAPAEPEPADQLQHDPLQEGQEREGERQREHCVPQAR